MRSDKRRRVTCLFQYTRCRFGLQRDYLAGINCRAATPPPAHCRSSSSLLAVITSLHLGHPRLLCQATGPAEVASIRQHVCQMRSTTVLVHCLGHVGGDTLRLEAVPTCRVGLREREREVPLDSKPLARQHGPRRASLVQSPRRGSKAVPELVSFPRDGDMCVGYLGPASIRVNNHLASRQAARHAEGMWLAAKSRIDARMHSPPRGCLWLCYPTFSIRRCFRQGLFGIGTSDERVGAGNT